MTRLSFQAQKHGLAPGFWAPQTAFSVDPSRRLFATVSKPFSVQNRGSAIRPEVMGLDLSMGAASHIRHNYYLEPPPEKRIGGLAFVPVLKKAGEHPHAHICNFLAF